MVEPAASYHPNTRQDLSRPLLLSTGLLVPERSLPALRTSGCLLRLLCRRPPDKGTDIRTGTAYCPAVKKDPYCQALLRVNRTRTAAKLQSQNEKPEADQ